ncbi:hypothetical protein ACOBQX_22990 [Actinokineospora sp. G85]|uniref:hypothetical protein n=1 Tax=Actinokineospora sp. G85 TaxID=3406626 RepID=UPI003C794FD0
MTDLTDLADLPGEWTATAEALLPSSTPAAQPAWTAEAVVAVVDGAPVGVLALHRSRTGVVGDVLDPAAVAPGLFGGVGVADVLYLGGVADLVAGTATAAHLSPADRAAVRRALVAAGVEQARLRGARPVALYVRDAEVDDFTAAGLGRERVAGTSTLAVAGTDEEFLAGLSANARRTVRKDRARAAEVGLRVRTEPAAALLADPAACAQAVELVMAVKRAHGVVDHPRLVRSRLAAWAARPAGERVAHLVDAGGPPLAVTFACAVERRVEVYETGMAGEGPVHEAYLESLVHAPLRQALAGGLVEVDLGLEAETPKTRRGAVVAPVWAVG